MAKKKQTRKRTHAKTEVVKTISVEGVTYQHKMISCGKERCRRCKSGPAHGPYWYAITWTGGKTKSRYVGKELPRIDEMLERPEFEIDRAGKS